MSEELLDKIDQIRARFPVSYESAKDVLEQTGGDLVKALVFLEKEQDEGWNVSDEILNRVKHIWETGNKTKLRIKKDDSVLVEIPATVGAIGAVLAPSLTFLGTIVALAGKCQIELEGLHVEEKTHATTD